MILHIPLALALVIESFLSARTASSCRPASFTWADVIHCIVTGDVCGLKLESPGAASAKRLPRADEAFVGGGPHSTSTVTTALLYR